MRTDYHGATGLQTVIQCALGDAGIAVASSSPIELTATTAEGDVARRYEGSLALSTADGALSIVNAVDVAAYVASVLVSEIGSSWHSEALQAQAIAARTYAVRRMRARCSGVHVGDDTGSQVYRGIDGITPALSMAARATRGRALLYDGQPADVFYSAICGGHTADAASLTGHPAPPYLGGVADVDGNGRAYCFSAPYFAWRNARKMRDPRGRPCDCRSRSDG